ncbi:hypothetical protein DRW48_14300 [Paracoccus suum]|uniref:Uncharacterized protein n=1 Tax=Paracoccus suum TaxID=2259340 RepID=A0A344PMU2_9RHOB|nr:hypothetical protein DRW48_14300 [Paracoccus suum]
MHRRLPRGLRHRLCGNPPRQPAFFRQRQFPVGVGIRRKEAPMSSIIYLVGLVVVVLFVLSLLGLR